jgi:hypothetical protein
MNKKDVSVFENLKIALANNGEHLTPVDVAGMALLARLAKAIDVAFDTGDLKDVPALVQRFTTLLDAYKLTPKSRNVVTTTTQEVADNGENFAKDYLRLIQTPTPVKASGRKVAGATSSRPSRKPRNAVNGVAKARNESGTGSKQPG